MRSHYLRWLAAAEAAPTNPRVAPPPSSSWRRKLEGERNSGNSLAARLCSSPQLARNSPGGDSPRIRRKGQRRCSPRPARFDSRRSRSQTQTQTMSANPDLQRGIPFAPSSHPGHLICPRPTALLSQESPSPASAQGAGVDGAEQGSTMWPQSWDEAPARDRPPSLLAPVPRQVLVPQKLNSQLLSPAAMARMNRSQWTRGDLRRPQLGALAHGVILAPAAPSDGTSAQLVSNTALHARHAAHAMYPILRMHDCTSAIRNLVRPTLRLYPQAHHRTPHRSFHRGPALAERRERHFWRCTWALLPSCLGTVSTPASLGCPPLLPQNPPSLLGRAIRSLNFLLTRAQTSCPHPRAVSIDFSPSHPHRGEPSNPHIPAIGLVPTLLDS